MKKLIALLLIAVSCKSGGPRYRGPSYLPPYQSEIEKDKRKHPKRYVLDKDKKGRDITPTGKAKRF
jgi:hypothetical protein